MASNKYKKTSLDLDFLSKMSTFKFRCTQCGKCCRNVKPEDKVLLTAVDLYRIAKVLDKEVTEVIGEYCDMVPGGESLLPLLVLKERMDGSCIFLKKGQCSVHEGKPIVCALNPLGRYLMYNDVTDDMDFHYHLKDIECGAARDEEVTVQEWLDRGNIEEYDECVKLYKRLANMCSKLMHVAKTVEDKREMFQTSFFLMYAKISKDIDLYGQLAQNLAFIQSINPELAFEPEKMS